MLTLDARWSIRMWLIFPNTCKERPDILQIHHVWWHSNKLHVLYVCMESQSQEQFEWLTGYYTWIPKHNGEMAGLRIATWAKSIQATNIAHPHTYIDLLWKRLDFRYVSPEVIEDLLQCRFAQLPRLTSNSRKEYFDLLDLATEILAIKKDNENMTLFSYFDLRKTTDICALFTDQSTSWSTA